MLTPRLEVSQKQASNTLLCEDEHELNHAIPSLSADSVVCPPTWVNLQSSHFCKGLYVLVKYDTMHQVFGKIIDLITVEQTYNLCDKIFW